MKQTIAEAMLNPYTRARAVGQLADWIRAGGGTYKDVLKSVKRIHSEAGKPVPSDAEIDWWLEEADMESA